MGKRLMQAEIEALRLTVPHAEPSDVARWVKGEPENVEDFAAYLKHFAGLPRDADGIPTTYDPPCCACGTEHAFRWGLAHGSGYCVECGWPGTLYHFVKDRHGADLVTFRGALLWAHPDDIDVAAKKSA